MQAPDIRVGQIWAEKDRRFPLRRIEVNEILGATVICTSWYAGAKDKKRKSRILLYRLTSDYQLFEDAV